MGINKTVKKSNMSQYPGVTISDIQCIPSNHPQVIHMIGQDGYLSEDDAAFNKKMRKYQERFDENALIIYPTMFALFNVGYWLHFLVFS